MMFNTRQALFVFTLIGSIYLLGIGIDVMDVDAAQYASMSREMLEKKSFFQLYDMNIDYLDKPPMLFWWSSLSIYLFGPTNFGYKLPSILFAFLAIYSTYKLALFFYKKEIALLAAIVLASSQALFLITQDCRTDTMLMGWVTVALWQLAAWFKNKKYIHVIIAFIAIGGGFLTKGPIALLVPAFAFGAHFLIQRNVRMLFRWEYVLGIGIVAVMLIPFCIGLYQQFDMHPEKIVYGKTGTSGVRFFLWTQSFGRITGESTWNNNADLSFQLLNLTWGFLPWFVFFIIALMKDFKAFIKFKPSSKEFVTIGGFTLSYLCIGSSKYQLPHYIYVVLPLAAIFTANFIYEIVYEKKYSHYYRLLYPLHIIIFSLLWLTAILINILVFPGNLQSTLILAVGCIGFILALKIRIGATPKLITFSLVTILGLNLFLSTHFYPQLLNYQSGSVVGRFIEKEKIPKSTFFTYILYPSHALSFYSQGIVKTIYSLNELKTGEYLFTNQDGLKELQQNKKFTYEIKLQGNSFAVTSLTLPFLNTKTRDSVVKPYYVLKINVNPSQSYN